MLLQVPRELITLVIFLEANMNVDIHKRYLLSNHELPRLRPKHKGLDNIHYNTTKIDGPQKPFRFAISEREAGKSSRWLQFYDYNYMRGETLLVLRRQIADVTETYVNDIENIINKFSYVPVRLIFKKGDLSSGIIDVYVAEYTKDLETGKEIYYNKRLFFRVLGMSNPMSRIKSLMLPGIKYIFFDEFICNLRLGEKYLSDEAFKFKEIYNTFQRECPTGLICYFFGNPYSLYNPYFEWLKVDTKDLHPGAYINGPNYTIEAYQLTKELRELILSRNPLYQFDDSYTKYAFNGIAINDVNILLSEKPNNAVLRYVFKIEGKYLGFFRVPPTDPRIWFYCEHLQWNPEFKRTAYCFDFNELGTNSAIVMDKKIFSPLKMALANNMVSFSKVACAYQAQLIYAKL